MNKLTNYQLSKYACTQIKGGGTKALEEEFGTITLNNGKTTTIVRLEEEFGVVINTKEEALVYIALANSQNQ